MHCSEQAPLLRYRGGKVLFVWLHQITTLETEHFRIQKTQSLSALWVLGVALEEEAEQAQFAGENKSRRDGLIRAESASVPSKVARRRTSLIKAHLF